MDRRWVSLNASVEAGLRETYDFEAPPRTDEELGRLAATITDHMISQDHGGTAASEERAHNLYGLRSLRSIRPLRRLPFIRKSPRPSVILYEPVIIGSDDCIEYQGGAFRTKAEAQAVLDIWLADGVAPATQMAINTVPLHSSVDQWRDER